MAGGDIAIALGQRHSIAAPVAFKCCRAISLYSSAASHDGQTHDPQTSDHILRAAIHMVQAIFLPALSPLRVRRFPGTIWHRRKKSGQGLLADFMSVRLSSGRSARGSYCAAAVDGLRQAGYQHLDFAVADDIGRGQQHMIASHTIDRPLPRITDKTGLQRRRLYTG